MHAWFVMGFIQIITPIIVQLSLVALAVWKNGLCWEAGTLFNGCLTVCFYLAWLTTGNVFAFRKATGICTGSTLGDGDLIPLGMPVAS